jgi:hypothetical protein
MQSNYTYNLNVCINLNLLHGRTLPSNLNLMANSKCINWNNHYVSIKHMKINLLQFPFTVLYKATNLIMSLMTQENFTECGLQFSKSSIIFGEHYLISLCFFIYSW